MEMPAPPRRTESFVVQSDSYEPAQGEFAHKSAATAAHNNTSALPVSVLRKSRTGAVRFRAQAVRPVSEAARVEVDPPDLLLPAPSAPACALIACGSAYARCASARLAHRRGEP
jgi:hypothetical protein